MAHPLANSAYTFRPQADRLLRFCVSKPPNRVFHSTHTRCGWFLAIALLLGLFLIGCGAKSKPISVSAIASSPTVDGTNSITVSATVTNDKNAAGVSWALSGAGALSGKTASSVTYTAPAATSSAVTVTITATSIADATKSSTVTITIPAKLSITTSTLATGNVGTAYSAQLSASGGISPYTWTLTSGTLPSCITLNSAGLVSSSSGLMASCAGTVALNFKVTDSGKPTALTATSALNLVVTAAPAITFTGTMPANATTGTAYNGSGAASGGAGALTYSISAGTLPAGLGMSTTTGAIAGSPTTTGSYSFTVKAADAYGDSQVWPCQISVMAPLAQIATGLPTSGTINVAYSGTITASGGSGNYSWQTTGLPSDALAAASNGATLTIAGTPTAQATVNFNVKLTDTTTQAVLTQAYTITVSAPTPVVLPSITLPAATVNQAYSAAITASGGVAPYTWSINGAAVSGAGLALSNGLSASNSGSKTLTITGTPSTTSIVTLTNVKVVDSLNTNATQSYSITVNGPGSQVTGSIFPASFCGSTVPPLPPITITLGTTPAMQTTTNSSGSFTFNNVPVGSYSLTPTTAGPPSGPNSVFYPATQQVTVNNSGQVGSATFSAMLGYNVSGTVVYHGTVTGQTYLNLVGDCGGGIGTSLSESALTSGGAFTLHGVPPGTYTLQAWMDPATLGNGAQNSSDPAGSAANVLVGNTNPTGVSVTMADPTITAVTTGPKLKAVAPTNSGVVVTYGGGSVLDPNTGIEAFTSYTVQWSTNSAFTGTPSSATFKATGTGYNVWVLNNGNSNMTGSLTSGTAYYFRARGTNSAGNTNWSYWAGAGIACGTTTCAVSVTVGEPSGGTYATVTGTVTITSEMTPIITGPLYVGYFEPKASTVYGYVISNPILGDNGYSISVLKSPTVGYVPFAILDQNKNGLIDVGDVTNFIDNPPSVVINSNTTGMIDLSYLYDRMSVQTHYIQSTSYNNGTPTTHGSYDLKFVGTPGNKLPVSVQLTAGKNVVVPVDIGNYCQGCGNVQFANEVFLGGATPTLGDQYTFQVTFSDGTSRQDYNQINPFNGTSTLTGPDQLPTNLVPSGNVPGQTQPTFSWTYPSLPAYAQPTYQFWLCCSGNYPIWWLPGYNSGLEGFTAIQIPGTLAWGVDPTDSTNKPSVTALTPGTSYVWQIQAQDEQGNVVAAQTSFIP